MVAAFRTTWLMLIATFVIFLGLTVVPNQANAQASQHVVEDGCAAGDRGFFTAAGPSTNWIIDRSIGSGGCHMRTYNSYSLLKISF